MHKQASPAQTRATLRQTFRERRKALSNAEQQQAAQAIVSQCQKLNLLDNSHHVAIYTTNDGELNTQALIEHLWSRNIHVYLPVLHPFCAGHLLFLQYLPSTKMVFNTYGIAEPELNVTNIIPINHLDIIFTPLVAFDRTGNRLGMGGGFYDRTLQSVLNNTKQINPPHGKQMQDSNKSSSTKKIIGLAHDVQESASLPVQAWDIPLPYILTPSRFFKFT